MVCQHYCRHLYLSQVCPTRRSAKGYPFPPGGGRAALNEAALRRRSRGERAWRPCADAVAPRLGWGGIEGEGVRPYWLAVAGISLLAALLVALALSGVTYGNDDLVHYRIVDGTIPELLTAQPGDPDRGRRIVLDRDGGDCTICHAMPLPQREFHGTVGPPLDGIGRRATPGALRLRLVNPKAFNAETIMPAYYKVAGLHRVLDRYRTMPVLTAQQIEDVIAYLLTLTD
jgi:L-cysteine S-thiosulfotransferase